ncbi:MAG: class C beta-lactamase-related serine hydrolase [Gammaproteobacteria bacterium]|nr:class C beta-lactamase-related serine hydrolase [Gammaproteobacteria bacterium]
MSKLLSSACANILGFSLALGSALVSAQMMRPPAALDAKESDPIVMGWMVGAPPPNNKIISFQDLSYMQFPQLRWSFSHWRELMPTTNVSRGIGKVSVWPRAERSDIDGVSFIPMGAQAPMTWADSLAANYTDGIVVIHRGRIVYERYFGALKSNGQHIAHSVTKSFFGTIGAMLVEEGLLDENALVTKYLPELKDSAFGDVTIEQVFDMTTALKFSELYTDPKAEIWDFARAAGITPWPAGYSGPHSMYEFLPTVIKQGEHGAGFTYRSPNAELITWLIRRVTGESAAKNLEEKIFAKLGAEQDAYIQVDPYGNAVGAGGLNLGLRDLARFGEMMRLGGVWNNQQIVPTRVVQDIQRGGSSAKFVAGGYTTLKGWSYRKLWWVSHNAHGAYMARGVHGQAIYIDPKAEMVIARFGSAPWASNIFLDPTSLPAYEALALHLMAND